MTRREAYDELCAYTLSRRDAAFIHQHVVDAYAAQTADPHTKPITLAFALIGLLLRVERRLTGRRVQQIHQRLTMRRRAWPRFPLPANRGAMTAADVLRVTPGPERDVAIDHWCASVWAAYQESHEAVTALLRRSGIL